VAQGSGNARKKQADYSAGPWEKWRVKAPHARAIRFIETYCRAPKGYGYGKPLKLRMDQKEWIEEILAPGVSSAAKSLPRGQGKSTEKAALAAWATFDVSDTGAPQVPIVATTVGQAIRSVYGVLESMVKLEPELDNRCIRYTAISDRRIEVARGEGTCFPIANDPDTLQGLDPSLAIMDEIGFQPPESWDSLLLASGKRSHSLVVGMGTPGFDRLNALWHLRSTVLEGGVIPGFIYRELSAPDDCDHRDEAVWYSVNPALRAGQQNIDSLRTTLGLTTEARFRTFHLGQWVDGNDCWLGDDGRTQWNNLLDPYEFVSRAPTWVGVDVGLKQDSTAVVVIQRRPDGRFHAKCRIWMPAKDNPLDVTDIMHYLRQLDKDYKLQAVAYDPRLFELPGQALAAEGLPMMEMPQSLERMTPAFATLLQAIREKQLTHDDDRAFATQILNGVERNNERGFTLMKAKSRGKIDAAYALAMALSRALIPVKERPPLVIMSLR
jgi:phage terminase large subunit-like protein